MSAFLIGVAVLLFATALGVLARLLSVSTPIDRLLVANLSGSLGVALLLLLAEIGEMPVLNDVALVLAVLVAVALSTFTSRHQATEGRAR